MDRIRLVIVGFGGMGNWHANSVREKVPEVEVYGAYDIRPEAREDAKNAALEAENLAQKIASEAKNTDKSYYDSAMASAKSKADSIIEDAKAKADSDAKALTAAADPKIDSAVNEIVSRIA
jgi:predicted dehydrogenase